ncbi:beta-lactamase family protein [Verrucomicrobia bacterium]|nr:beta-lactamase family protein [Verrucomicrobiota bacterium]
MKTDSPLRVASLTKPFSATVVARLVGAGKFSWEFSIGGDY